MMGSFKENDGNICSYMEADHWGGNVWGVSMATSIHVGPFIRPQGSTIYLLKICLQPDQLFQIKLHTSADSPSLYVLTLHFHLFSVFFLLCQGLFKPTTHTDSSFISSLHNSFFSTFFSNLYDRTWIGFVWVKERTSANTHNPREDDSDD